MFRFTVCASSGIQRSRSRMELLHARSSIVIAARAYGLSAIDMVCTPWSLLHEQFKVIQPITPQVCVDYKDLTVLKEESEEGRRLGFQAKVSIMTHTWPLCQYLTCFSQQAIHPSQVETIVDAYAPSTQGKGYHRSCKKHRC